MEGRLLRVTVMLTALSAASCAYRPPALPPEAEPVSTLCRARAIRTKPFEHSTVSVRDAESIVHVPGDDNLWVGDDNSHTVFEIDRRTGQFRSRTTEQDIINAFPEAGSCDDGDRDPRTQCSYTGELEIVTYDPAGRTLLLFNTVSRPQLEPPVDKPALYRLQKEHGRGRFKLVDWQELPAGHRYGPAAVIDGKLYLAIWGEVVEYNIAQNRFADLDDMGTPLPAVTATTEGYIVGMAFDGSSLWILTDRKRLLQVNWDTKAVVGNHDIAPFGISKAKGLGFGEGEFFIPDGDPPNLIHVLRFGTLAKISWWRGGGQSLSCG
jgi:hypothetical protein